MRRLALALAGMAVASSALAQPLFIGSSYLVPGTQGIGSATFNTVQAGGTASLSCRNICFSNGGGANCLGSGTMAATALPSAPFTVQNFRKGTTCGNAVPVTLPTSLAPNQVLYYDAVFHPTAPGRYIDGVVLASGEYDLYGTATSTYPCMPNATTGCLNAGRFRVTASYQTANANGNAQVVPLTGDSAYLWFFDKGNVEVFIKVLDGCGVTQAYWVYAAGATDQGVTITVTDTAHNVTKQYSSPLHTTFVTRTDIGAFATCP